jgi:anti-sigma B factor antagonist
VVGKLPVRRGGIDIDLSLDTRELGEWTVVAVSGELDLYTAPALREEIQGLSDRGVTHVVIDLSTVGFVDSSGLGAIVACLKRLRERDGALELVAPESSPINRLLSLTGLDHAIRTHPSADDVVDV